MLREVENKALVRWDWPPRKDTPEFKVGYVQMSTAYSGWNLYNGYGFLFINFLNLIFIQPRNALGFIFMEGFEVFHLPNLVNLAQC